MSLHAHRIAALAATVHRHPRRFAGAVATLLAGVGVAAFGIAPLAPDAAALPRRMVIEAADVLPLDAQLEALAGHDLVLTRSATTRAGESIESLLRRLGLADPAAARYARGEPALRATLDGKPGRLVQARAGSDGRLVELIVRAPGEQPGRFLRQTLRRGGDGFAFEAQTVPLQAQSRLASGTIASSLFQATDESGLPDAVASQLAEIFSGDIDFHRELRRGDTFSVVYESLTADGETVPWAGAGARVLAAEFVNKGRVHQALWFSDAQGRGGYYGFDGQSRRRAFLASPIAFSRVTSGFAMRMHPIFKQWRAHLGVDYAAPSGTAVRTVGDGVVAFAGWQNGFGKVVHVTHGNRRTTVYAHLRRIDVKAGQRLEQGQALGAVGATGWATGPHLHFEFRVDGKHQDPLRLARAAETVPVAAQERPRFERVALLARGQLETASTLTGARGFAD